MEIKAVWAVQDQQLAVKPKYTSYRVLNEK